MDIKQLKLNVNKYIVAMKKDGKDFLFVALIPTYPGIDDTSYILQVKADWIDRIHCKKVFDYMIPKMFEVLDQPTRRCINRIDIFDEKSDIYCMSKDLIIRNSINYNPTQFVDCCPPQWYFR